MRISITVVATDVAVSQDFVSLEVLPDMALETVKGFVQEEMGVPPSSQFFLINNQPVMNTSQTLTALGVNEGDILSLVVRSEQPTRGQTQATSSRSDRPSQQQSRLPQDSETLRLLLLGDPHALNGLRAKDPELAAATNSSENFRRLWNERQQQNAAQQREKEEMMALLDSDPFNVEAQMKIEEIIRQELVMENMRKAMDENPESFARVTMLYIDVLVNNIPIKAFVDSGAQTTIMSPDAVERCGITRLIDRRFGGMARGVGTAKILGRVHHADIQVGQYSLASSFTVMEGKGVDLLLGLDMLKKHQMSIDLKENCLRFQDERVSFLPESEIPKDFEEAVADVDEPKLEGPGNTQIGANTGTVNPKSPETGTSAAGPSSSGIRIHPQGSAGNVASRPPPGIQQQNPIGAFGQTGPITEESIRQITDLGFSREEAVAALQQTQGNVELAVGLLL